MNDQMDLALGLALQDAGIRQAMEHADDVHGDWQGIATAFLDSYIKRRPVAASFTGRDVRIWATDNGCPQPPTDRAWGGIIQGAAKQKKIFRVGFTNSKTPSSHGAPVSVWVAA